MTGFAGAGAALPGEDAFATGCAAAVAVLAEARDPAAPDADDPDDPDDEFEPAETEPVETDDSGRSFFPSFSGDLATGASFKLRAGYLGQPAVLAVGGIAPIRR
jgi:hypothetical protein